jgi:hypothetical protein
MESPAPGGLLAEQPAGVAPGLQVEVPPPPELPPAAPPAALGQLTPGEPSASVLTPAYSRCPAKAEHAPRARTAKRSLRARRRVVLVCAAASRGA